jgi:hypothetical protein
MASLRILRTHRERPLLARSTDPFVRTPKARRNNFGKTDRSATRGDVGSMRNMISENQSNPLVASKLFKVKLSHRPSAPRISTNNPLNPGPAKFPSLATPWVPKRPLSLKSRVFRKLIAKWHCNSCRPRTDQPDRPDRPDRFLSCAI